ncbi:MAG: tRNA pseudouridine(55) synthase TruB [Oscillospiraceae bacterium]|nr:tRNA pseudouridine(55) synthase TruB [Oscillospiraceae bacterium]MBR6561976.1 tRNA pseudouridine(55) synthase TruB [Oscillospiraceae bacterium]
MTGILLVDKSEGWTSHDVVAKLRGVTREKRIGHAGTLDPMATGLLVVFLGRATRAVEFAEADEKTYIAGLRLGLCTDTQDTTGNTLSVCDALPSRVELEEKLKLFRGEIEQIPPMYSAIKHEGKKLYELARKGVEVERKARSVTIHELEILSGSDADYSLRIRCSKGTYVRTLCHDIGQALGCGGCMSSLRRVHAGAFRVEQACTIDELADAETVEKRLISVDALFSELPAYTVGERDLRLVYNGNSVSAPTLDDGRYRVYAPDGEFLMLGEAEDGCLKTVKSFFMPK